MDDRWMSIADLMDYSALSRDTLERAMRHPEDPLPFTKVGAAVRVRRSVFDAWMERRQSVQRPVPDVRDLVEWADAHERPRLRKPPRKPRQPAATKSNTPHGTP